MQDRFTNSSTTNVNTWDADYANWIGLVPWSTRSAASHRNHEKFVGSDLIKTKLHAAATAPDIKSVAGTIRPIRLIRTPGVTESCNGSKPVEARHAAHYINTWETDHAN